MPSCSNCGDQFPSARRNLGYRTCLPCGDHVAQTVRWLAAPLNKSNYVLISNLEDLKGLNPKRLGE
jgi:hypothetical protein